MEPHDRDGWDEWLNKALQKYGSINPRPGLEKRVLTSLQAQQRARTRRLWTWALASAAAAFLVLFVWRGLESPRLNKHDNQPIAHVPQGPASEHQAQVLPPIPQRPRTRANKRLRPVITETRSHPKLERFPSPRPLSPEELAVARYAEHYPQEALLIANEQQKFDEEVRQAQEQVETSFSISNE
jgi:hypothetical protein